MDTDIDKVSTVQKENEEIDNIIDDSVNIQKNLKSGTAGGTEISEGSLGVSVVSEMKTEINKTPKFFCLLCQQAFSRADSLSRHMTHKHLSVDNRTKSPKRPATETQSYNQEGSKRRQKTAKFSFQQIAETKERKLQVVLSNKMPSVKKASVCVHKEERQKSSSVSSPEEEAVLQALKDSCKKLQEIGRQVLVITVNSHHSLWFGSDHGLGFAQDHVEVISSFFNYCKGKTDAFQKEKVQKSKEKLTNTNDSKSEMDCDSDGDDVHLDEKKYRDEDYKVCEDGEEEMEDDDADDADADDDYADDDDKQDDSKRIPEPYRRYLEKKDKLFEELAVGFIEAEETRDVSPLLKKTVKAGSTRPVAFTVEDLNKGPYKCSACGYNFLWKCHLELHQVKNPYCGRVTNFKMSKTDVLTESITFQNPETGVQITSTFQDLLDSQTVHPLTCAICRKSNFRDRSLLRRHLFTHNRANIFECNICCESFSHHGNLSSHLKVHFRKPFECHRCQWRFSDAKKLQHHCESGCRTVSLINNKEKESSFETTEYKCDICFAEVTGMGTLREHLTSEHEKQFGEFDCVLCDQKFPDTILYNRHLLTHDKKYPCPFCPKKFGAKSETYYSHIKSHKHTEQIEFPFVCDICGEQFRLKRYLDPHRRIHTGERPFLCEEEGCGKSFRSKDGLDQHKWCHKNQHFLCDFCGRKFKKPSFLRNHRRTHTVDWRYPCIYCPEKFRKLRPFKHHLAKNHPTCVEEVKEKFKIILHACHLCPKVFYDKEDFTAHNNRHNGVKPFPCKYCGKGFNDKSNLLQHEATHSGGKRLKCNWCSRRFNEEKYLESHIERHHTAKPENSEQPMGKDDIDEEDIDELRENTLQIIDETIRGNVSY